MSKLPWILLLVGVGGTALYFRSRRAKPLGDTPSTLQALQAAAQHPIVFGVGAGLANGLLATVRRKQVSTAANLVTASVVGISEGMLSPDPKKAIPIAVLSALGTTAGMALFTRWKPTQRALIEAKSVPAP